MRKYQSKIAGVVHRAMEGAHRAGVANKTTMREFDAMCLTKVEHLKPKDIVAIRERAGVSQQVFAYHLNVSVTVVSQWERGERRPTGTAVKLLSLVKRKGLEAIA
jgi:putative transcriptional regulator